MDCVFCGIAAKTIPATVLYEDETVLAFRDLNPRAPLHALVIPKVHVASLADATDPAVVGRVALAAAAVATAAGYGERGYRVVANTGPDAGQSVGHLHFHVLAGRHLGWPPG